jgi:DNA repair photolyase
MLRQHDIINEQKAKRSEGATLRLTLAGAVRLRRYTVTASAPASTELPSMADRSASLFPLTLHPTTREVARLVKHGGADALTEAQRRADDARYQEVRCRSALNPVKGMPFRWTLNPYRGCTHGCHYCFARRYHEQFELGAGDEFATVILVKTNLPEVLRRELVRPAWARELVAVGTATDPYQPIEGHYKLTRRSLETLCAARTPVGLVTKGPMVVRDTDLFTAIAEVASCTVYVSVPSVNEDAWRRLEPGTASPWQRLKAVRALSDAGVHVGVLMAPLVPGITADSESVESTIRAVADHGAQFVGANVLYLQGGTRAHFLQFLGREYPELIEAYDELYAGGSKYARRDYAADVQGMVRALRARHGMTSTERPRQEARESPPARREQAAFDWS